MTNVKQFDEAIVIMTLVNLVLLIIISELKALSWYMVLQAPNIMTIWINYLINYHANQECTLVQINN